MTKYASFDFKAGQIKSPLHFQYLLSACFLKNVVITYKASLGSPRLPQYKTCNMWHTKHNTTQHNTTHCL